MSVLELFEASVQSNHSAIAVVLESGEESTYWQLNNIADNLATAILPFIRTDYTEETQLVCIMMNRHTPLIASMLAILKCGAAYVPVDPGFPPDRQEYIFNHSKCSLLVADEECFEVALRLAIGLPPSLVICAATGKVISATNVVPSSVVSSQSFSKARALAVAREDGGLMYVLYTSGSTGRPKGVMVVRGVANIVSWFAKELETNASTRVLALTTTCFDISVLEIYLPLISGGTLVLASSSSQKNPFQLLEGNIAPAYVELEFIS
jgi:iturin family lipopeptide synthetase A